MSDNNGKTERRTSSASGNRRRTTSGEHPDRSSARRRARQREADLRQRSRRDSSANVFSSALASLFSSGSDGRGGSSRASTRDVADSSRAFFILIVFLVLAALFTVRLLYLQVFAAGDLSAQASAARSVDIETTPRRGTIYDRNGTVLATSVDATTIYANPSEIEDVDETAAVLMTYLGGDVETYKEKLSNSRATFVYIKRKADVDVAEKLAEAGLDGVYFIDDTRREYPLGRIGGQVVGVCDIDGNGISGLELYYNDILAGTPGRLAYERGAYGIPIPGGVSEEVAAVDGQDIVISIDIQLQDFVERRLEQCAEDLTAESSTCIIMDAATGEIYAAASPPYFNPADTSVVEEGATTIRGITGAIEPGSIFKTVATMSILETNTMTPDTEIFCPSQLEADGYIVEDAHSRDAVTMTLREILDNSSNIGISLATEQMGFAPFYRYIQAYNLTEKTGVDYPGEASGYLLSQDQWSLVQSYNVTFGQGVSVTPLQMTRFYGAIANDGIEVVPHFLVSKPQSGETPTYETEQVIENTQAIPTMTDMLTTVVESGTGVGAQIEGYTVAGKTSTAEISDPSTGGYKKGIYNLAFTGFLPNSSSQLVCYVGAYEVPWQADVTGVFKDIMSYAIDRFKINPK